MKWRNAKKVAPLPDRVTVFYFGDYEYMVGKVLTSDSDDTKLMVVPEEDGPGCENYNRVKVWSYIKVPPIEEDYGL